MSEPAITLPVEDQNALYRGKMEGPMEALAITLENYGADLCDGGLNDCEIVELATRKITMLREMILATGFSNGLLEATMKG